MFEVKFGELVSALIQGQGQDGTFPIPFGSMIELGSSDPSVATIQPSVEVPEGGLEETVVALEVLAPGTTEISVLVTDPDGNLYSASAILTVTESLTGVSITLFTPASE